MDKGGRHHAVAFIGNGRVFSCTQRPLKLLIDFTIHPADQRFQILHPFAQNLPVFGFFFVFFFRAPPVFQQIENAGNGEEHQNRYEDEEEDRRVLFF